MLLSIFIWRLSTTGGSQLWDCNGTQRIMREQRYWGSKLRQTNSDSNATQTAYCYSNIAQAAYCDSNATQAAYCDSNITQASNWQ